MFVQQVESVLIRTGLAPSDLEIEITESSLGSEKDQAIAKVIIGLANKMSLKVIAEGVETKHQLDFLSELLCDEIQGYYFYQPMPAEEIEKIFLNSPENRCVH